MRNIRALTDSLGFFFEYDPKNDVVNHPSGIMFLTPTGGISSYILGISYTPERFTTNLETAKAVAGGNP